MKAMGFRWDEERRTWTRRPPDIKKPPKPLRSGMRLLKLGDASPDERAAAEVFMERLRTARKASFRDTDTSTKLSKFLKYCLSQPATLPVFGVACIGLGAAAGTGADPAKVGPYAAENLDIYGFALTADEVDTLSKIPPIVES